MAMGRKQALNARLNALTSQRTSWLTEWRVLSEFIDPTRGRFVASDANKYKRKTKQMINNRPRMALRTLSAGMMAGLTSPSRPWFKLTMPDQDLANFPTVRAWLTTVEQRMLSIFARGNLYNVLPQAYREMGGFGQAVVVELEDFQDVARFYTFTVGSYYLSNNDRMVVDTMYRDVDMTVRQMVDQFGIKKLSPTAKSLWDAGKAETYVPIVHVIQPNKNRDVTQVNAINMPYSSVWYEKGADDESYLKQSGFEENALMAPRWDVVGNDAYGHGPGHDALGDSKALQHEERMKGTAIDKQVNPPLNAPADMKGKRATMVPGGVNYVSDTMNGLKPTHEVSPDVRALLEDLRANEERISRAFYEDIFQAVITSTRRQVTAREIEELADEKLIALGPTLERTHDELLDPIIRRTYSIMERNNLLPPPPKELEGQNIRVEYISILARAQKATELQGIERYVAFAQALAATNPEALDKVAVDKVMDHYGDNLNTPPDVIRSTDEANGLREQRAQAAAMQQAIATAQEGADVAKTMSDVKTDEANGFTAVAGQQA